MKHFLLIVFFFFSVVAFAQAARTEKIKITKSQFGKAKTLNDLLPALPKECPVSAYKFALDTHESKRLINIKNNEISSDLKSIIKEMKAGDEFFIENIMSDCKTPFRKSYIFIVTS